jgi:hypothetical protein
MGTMLLVAWCSLLVEDRDRELKTKYLVNTANTDQTDNHGSDSYN